MGDFSNRKVITSISDILDKIEPNANTINLSNNVIRKAEFELLPINVINVFIDDNVIDEMSWDNRKWGIISVKNNGFNPNEISNLTCVKLILDDNQVEDITFSNCVIDELSVQNNNIENINFFDCNIKKLNLSVNKISNLITLPNGLVSLILYGNLIKNINVNFENTITYLDLSDNKIEYIDKIPENLIFLDVSKNKFKNFNVENFPETIEHFDITENFIENNEELFKNINAPNLFYDTDDTDSDTSELSIVPGYKFGTKGKDFKLIDISDDEPDEFDEFDYFEDGEIMSAINEYKNSNQDGTLITSDTNENKTLKENNLSEPTDTNENNDSLNPIDKRDLMLKAAIERFRNSNSNSNSNSRVTIIKKTYSELSVVPLQWNFTL